MAYKPHPEMGYRSCLSIIGLAEKYSAERVEAASAHALHTGACRYKNIESIPHNLSRRRTITSAAPGASSEARMLHVPMREKLTAMRLLGVPDALKAKEQDPAAHKLSFLK